MCPCQMLHPLGKAYSQCCEPLHLGKPAETPEQLMRSRFSGFVLGLSDYITRSWHSSTCPTELDLSPDENWLKLDVVKAEANQVHFRAYFKDEEDFCVLDEISDFVFENNHWLYVSGITQSHTIALNRNDKCLCGSGKKYKKCCSNK